MVVHPEQAEAACSSDVDVTITSPPTQKTSPECDDVDETLPHKCYSPNSGGELKDSNPSQSDGACELPDTARQSEDPPPGPRVSGRGSSFKTEIKMEDVATEVKVIKKLRRSQSIGSGAIENSSKLVSELNKELALLHGLAQGIGVDTDCQKLRQQLHHSQHRACSLATQNSASLVPLVRRKTALATEQVATVERLYRIYSGSLEYLLYLLRKVRSLLSHFRLSQETRLFIRTGISDPADICKSASSGHKVGEAYLQRCVEDSSSDALPARGKEDLLRLSRDIRSMQQLLDKVTNACDTHPWHVGEEEEVEGEEEQSQQEQGLRARAMSFRFSVKRQSRKSESRVSRAPEEEEGKLPEKEIPVPEVTQSTPPSQSKPKAKSTWCCLLCGLGDKDVYPEDQTQVVVPDSKGDSKAAPDQVHIMVTDCAGDSCLVD